jgi:hypothetical protein
MSTETRNSQKFCPLRRRPRAQQRPTTAITSTVNSLEPFPRFCQSRRWDRADAGCGLLRFRQSAHTEFSPGSPLGRQESAAVEVNRGVLVANVDVGLLLP